MSGAILCDGVLMLNQKAWLGSQEIAPDGAFSAADFQQHRVDLVFHLDGVHHPAIIIARLVDENDGGHADRDQHQKSRRKQQDLANRAAARGIGGHKRLG